jgi:hypothetical protein
MINLHEGEGDTGAESFSGEGQLLKLTLKVEGCEPPVWRQLVLRDSLWLSDLHDAIQIMLGWYDYQTHVFRIGKTAYGNPFRREDFLVEDDRNLLLSDTDLARAGAFHYDYHFGEGWTVEIRVERAAGEFGESPVCVAGERAGPPEDCGGIEAYHDMLECIKEPYSQLGREWVEWLGEGFDPEKCDLAAINKALSEIGKEPPDLP